MNLFPYQEEGRKFLMENRFAFLADQPGLGKTPQAIRASRDIAVGSFNAKICVICPKPAVENWRREFKRWWPGHTVENDMVVNYDKLVIDGSREQEVFKRTSWDFIIIDEAHRLKSPGAKRTQNIYRHIAKMKRERPRMRVWLLSGTPAKNHAGELWTHLAILRPDLILDRSGRAMAQEQFEERYCKVGFDQHGHRRIRGSKNIKELRERLYDGGFLLRRRKSEVQSELPDLIFDDYPLPGTDPVKGGMQHMLNPDMSVDEAMVFLKDNAQSLANWRHDVAQVKVPLVKDYVENELEAPGEKLIVFFHHTVLGRELHHLLAEYQPVIVDGKTKDAQAEVDEFQDNPDCRVFLGQISTCQEALNITAATQVAFAEAAWSPSDNYQAACRAHRIGMGDSLVVRFLSLANSPDEIVQRTLARKAVELAELFD